MRALRIMLVGFSAILFIFTVIGLVGKYVSSSADNNPLVAESINKYARDHTLLGRKAEIVQMLRRAGWICPEIKHAQWRSEDAQGTNAKILCGWADGTSNVLRDRIFNVTLRPDGSIDARQGNLKD